MSTSVSVHPPRLLLPGAWRPVAALSWLVSLALLVVLAVHLHATGKGTRIDRRLDSRVAYRLADQHGLLRLLVEIGSVGGVIVGSLALAAVAASHRWWRGVLLSLLAAPLAAGVTELILKPVVGVAGLGGVGLGFPSGHTTGAFGLAVTACVLLLPGPAVHPLPAVLRVLLGIAALVLATGSGIALVALRYHRTTDVVGGVVTAVLVVLTLALVLDLSARRRTSA